MDRLSDAATYRSHLERLADARRVLSISNKLDRSPVLTVDDRHAIQKAKLLAWNVIAETVEGLVEVLDAASGDPDLEAGDAEDDFTDHRRAPWRGPGCPIADAGEDDDPAEEDDPAGGDVVDEPHDPEDGL